MKKRIGIGVLVVGVLAFFFFTRTKMPKYSPERDYIDMEAQILEAFILAKDSSTIQLPEGHFLFSQSLSLDAKKHITIKGMGMDKTILSFKGQTQGAEGIKVTNSENVTIEDLAVEDAAGDNIKISDTDTLILRNIRSAWTGKVSTENGAYALYPVLSTQVLIEGCEAIGSSDAGIYVGQSQNVIIRNNKAYYNVAGIESENSSNVEIYGNEAFENTSGLLIFNLPELTVYGKQVKAYQNKIYNNNIPNFGVKGSIVSAVPKGTGVVIMATQDIAFYDNTVEDHKTSNLSIVSYKVFAADEDPQNNS
jgi:parallel beta-helix repeat protein